LLQITQPDVLITDIKMPFMDGLQLSKIMRERMPWVKIIILSGHDEFEYAQHAIKLGVTDYILKPITVKKLQAVLQNLAVKLDQERKEQDNLRKLNEQAEENRLTQRERLLFKLIVGAVSPTEAIESGQALELNLAARHYLVMILKIELDDRSDLYEHDEYQQVQRKIISLIDKNPDLFMLRRDWGDLILIMKGTTPDYLEEERDILLDKVRRDVSETRFKLTFGNGTIKSRITDICQSFVEALVQIQNPDDEEKTGPNKYLEGMELLRVDNTAVENYLHSGVKEGFDEFYSAYLLPLGETALKSNLIKNYIFVDVVLAIAKLVNDFNGEVDKVIPELNSIEMIMSKIKTTEQLREQIYNILSTALDFRDNQPKGQYVEIIRRTKEYIEQSYSDPELSLNKVANLANLSSSHFSVVFSKENGLTFKEYLTDIRMNRAKELLRMTALKSADIAYQVGYNDPHYFSTAFKKHTGLTPTEFRFQV
jgi:two-component system, response regulator YesN